MLSRTHTHHAVLAAWGLLLVLASLRLTSGIGYSDNGDFRRTLTHSGLWHPTLRAGEAYPASTSLYSLDPHFVFNGANVYGAVDWVTAGATRLFRWIHPERFWSGWFPKALLPSLYLLVIFGALALRCAHSNPSLFPLAAVWLCLDPFYFGFLNSFYGEGAALMSLLLLSFLMYRPSPLRTFSTLRMGGVLICALVLSFSKMQYIGTCAGLLGLLLWTELALPQGSRDRVFALFITLALSLCVGALLVVRYPVGSQWVSRYNALYRGVLTVHPDPYGVLNTLGFPPRAMKALGENIYTQEGWHRAVERYKEPLSAYPRWKLWALTLGSPVAREELGRRIRFALTSPSVPRLTLFPRSAEASGHTTCAAFDHCNIKQWIVGTNLSQTVYAAGVLLAPPLAVAFRWVQSRLLLTFLWSFFASQVFVIYFFEGLADFGRHLSAARFAADLAVLLLLCEGGATLTRQWGRFRESLPRWRGRLRWSPFGA